MFTSRGANVHFSPDDLPEESFAGAALLYISGYSLLEAPQAEAVWQAVELAKNNGVAISLDTGLEPALIIPDELRRLIKQVDVCVTGPEETAELFGLDDPERAAEHLLALGIKLAAIKLGKDGCYAASPNEKCFCPAFRVETVDTTGAGDSFTAGLLYGWLRGWGLPAGALLGSALGALAASVRGAGLALPGREAALGFLKARRADVSANLRDALTEAIHHLENS